MPVAVTTGAVSTKISTIKTTAESFTAALKQSLKLPKNNILPVLNSVRIADTQVIATDLDSTTFVDFQATGKGDFLVPFHQTLGVLAGEKGELVITHRDTSVRLAINGCEYEFESLPVTSYPVAASIPDTTGAIIDGKAFGAMLARTRFAVSKEESRYTLQGVLLKVQQGKALMASTDGHRMALAESEAHGAGLTAVVGLDAINWLHANSGEPVVIAANDEVVKFDLGDKLVVTRRMKGVFPNYEAVIPAKSSHKLVVSFPAADALAKTLARVAKCSDERSGAVRFAFGPQSSVSAHSTEFGKASAKLDSVLVLGSKSIEIGFNHAYIAEFLKLAGKEPVTVALVDNQSAVMFESGEGWSYIVMPMRM